jgi:hypothetical protein
MNLTTLSLGAGRQSTTLVLLMAEGRLPKVDALIFADTGWEPPWVYRTVDRIREVVTPLGVPLHVVSVGSLRADAIDPAHRYASIPYYVRNPDGSDGQGRRQCTSEYKLAAINRKVRELLGAPAPDFRRVPKGNAVEQWIGFSADEVLRLSDLEDGGEDEFGAPVKRRTPLYVTKRYPLMELGMDVAMCERFLAARGWVVKKSACIGCPYHGNKQWRDLRDNHPDLWEDACEFDEAIRKGGARGLPLNGEAFLHRSRVPLRLAPIDRITRAERLSAQGDLFEVLNEDGDPDGCSPYGCRSGLAVTA